MEQNKVVPINHNLTMLTDFYEITMANGYFMNGFQDKIAYFDMFFRKIPDGGGYAIMCGVQQLIEYLERLRFTDEDIEFLRSKNIFDEGFCPICAISNSAATYGPSRRERLSSPASRS